MLGYFFSNTIIGFLLGNLIGLIKSIGKQETIFWKSKFFIEYLPKGGVAFALIWAMGIMTGGYLSLTLATPNLAGRLLAVSFFVTGLLFLTFTINYLNRAYILPTRIVLRRFFWSFQVIENKDIVGILCNKYGGLYADIIYNHPVFGYTSLYRSYPYLNIPIEVFKNSAISIDPNKLKSILPQEPIIHNRKKAYSFLDYFLVILFLFLNPYSATLLFAYLFGILTLHPAFFIITDISYALTRSYFKYLSSSNASTLDPSLGIPLNKNG